MNMKIQRGLERGVCEPTGERGSVRAVADQALPSDKVAHWTTHPLPRPLSYKRDTYSNADHLLFLILASFRIAPCLTLTRFCPFQFSQRMFFKAFM